MTWWNPKTWGKKADVGEFARAASRDRKRQKAAPSPGLRRVAMDWSAVQSPMTDTEMAALFGCGRSTVCSRRKEDGAMRSAGKSENGHLLWIFNGKAARKEASPVPKGDEWLLSRDVAALTGMRSRQVFYWANRNGIRTRIANGGGTKTRTLYHKGDVNTAFATEQQAATPTRETVPAVPQCSVPRPAAARRLRQARLDLGKGFYRYDIDNVWYAGPFPVAIVEDKWHGQKETPAHCEFQAECIGALAERARLPFFWMEWLDDENGWKVYVRPMNRLGQGYVPEPVMMDLDEYRDLEKIVREDAARAAS